MTKQSSIACVSFIIFKTGMADVSWRIAGETKPEQQGDAKTFFYNFDFPGLHMFLYLPPRMCVALWRYLPISRKAIIRAL
ncbi:MAG: hypothetical protein CMN77_13590 [Spirochaetaceae bacterium]|nr:hypothetical protein [Spirochaetaceae bacterium]